MTDAQTVAAWVERYRVAWESNDPEDIGGLFTEDAVYYAKPGVQPYRGRAEIVARWLEYKDEPGDTTFTYEVIATEGDLGIVRAVTDYVSAGRIYDNLWEIELEGDWCRRFTEWWIQRPG